jgi:hypothetical protein
MASWCHDCWTWEKVVHLTCIKQQCEAGIQMWFLIFLSHPGYHGAFVGYHGSYFVSFYKIYCIADSACCQIIFAVKWILVCLCWNDFDWAFWAHLGELLRSRIVRGQNQKQNKIFLMGKDTWHNTCFFIWPIFQGHRSQTSKNVTMIACFVINWTRISKN